MRIESLEYLIELDRAGSLNKAAKNLYISQQGLSHVIGSLEAELGVRLVNRTRQGSAFTQAGVCALEFAKSVVRERAELEARLGPLRLAHRGKEAANGIELVVSSYASLTLLAIAMAELETPIGFKTREWGNERILEALATGLPEDDAAAKGKLFLFDWLVSDRPDVRDAPGAAASETILEPLCESNLGIVCHADSTLGQAHSATLKDASALSLVCYSGDDYLQTIGRALGSRNIADAALEVSDMRAIAAYLARHEDAGAVSDELSFRLQASGNADAKRLAFVPLRGIAALRVGFAYDTADPNTFAYRRFIEDFRRACTLSQS